MSEPEDVLGKADALMQRHRSFVAGGRPAAAAAEDDIPVLTDEVELDEADAEDAAAAEQRLQEILNRLEPEIARRVQEWLAAELPHIVARELGALGPRLIQSAHQSLQQVLAPELSRLLHSAGRDSPPGEAP
ncbi:MAG: hypothetical protein AB1768_05995 [Pseudomonadota bacterium]|jgi:hypothetical protein